jgi:hypothetical protein
MVCLLQLVVFIEARLDNVFFDRCESGCNTSLEVEQYAVDLRCEHKQQHDAEISPLTAIMITK